MKNRILAILICIIFSAGTICIPPAVYASGYELVLNESFNQYMTNEVLYDLEVRSPAHYIKEYRSGDKGMFLSTLKSGASLGYKFAEIKNACISFDVMSVGDTLTGSVNLSDSGGKSVTAVKFEKRHHITTSNGRHIGGYSQNNVTNVAICVDEKNSCMDIYINGKLMSDDTIMFSKAITGVSTVTFSFGSAADDDVSAGVILDNINVHSGKILKKYPISAFNPEQAPEVEIKLEGKAAGGKVLDTDFNQEPSFTLAPKGNVIERYAENETNMTSLHERVNTSDFHTDVKGVSSLSDYVVYEYDIKLLNVQETAMRVWLKDVNANYSSMCIFQKGGNLTLGSYNTKLTQDRWYRISTVYNYYDRTKNYYIDGKLVCENDPVETVLGTAADIDVFRFHVEAKSSVDGNRSKFLLDNIRVYETKEPMEDISALVRTVEINRDISTFDSEKNIEKSLKGFTALHTRSGVVIKDGKRHILPTVPEGIGAEAMVVADEICSILGVEYDDASGVVKIDGKEVQSFQTKKQNGKTYISINTFFDDILGKKVYFNDSALSFGLVVAGDTLFVPPSDSHELQLLNNYVFFTRPDEEAVATAYKNSPSYGVHPRIHATAQDFDRIRKEIKTDSNKAQLYTQLIAKADEITSNNVAVKYELRDGTRLLDVCREVIRNMYVLGLAYQLSGDKKYVDRAWTDLEAVSTFPDWHPNHSLDPAEMSVAVSIGYDWMYDAFTKEQRAIIENGVYNNLFYVTCNSIQHKKGYLSGGLRTDMNHNLIINSGISVGAMCFMDVYPEISGYILSNSLRSIGNAIYNYGPDGAWVEGPHYWEYSTQYTTKLLSVLDTAMGTDFRLSLVEGLSTAAEFILYTQSDIGIFNYGDGAVSRQYVPEILWLADKYELSGTVASWLELSQLKMSNYEDVVLALLWLDAYVESGQTDMPTDAFYKGENVVTFRDKWTKEFGTFVGIHGGQTIVNHSHLDGGSFVFDSMGVRWACDPGSGPYDLPDCWDTVNGGRWKYYMTRAEAHNCVVINPDENPDHNPFSKVTIDRYESEPKGGIAVADTSELYCDDALSARRGFFFTDNRRSLVIRDEITLKKKSEVYWFMQTAADVAVTDNGAILSYDGKRMKLEAMCDAKIEILSGESVPLPTSPVMAKDLIPGLKRIIIKYTASGDTALTVKLTPYGMGSTDISDYHKRIDLWKIPEGDPETFIAPELVSAYADSQPLIFNSDKTVTIGIAGGKNLKYPQITAETDTSRYNLEIIDEKAYGFTAIKVTDKNNVLNASTYIVDYKIVPEPMEFDGMISVPVSAVTVSSEPQPENHVYNIFDSDISTRWSAKGEDQWVILELSEETVVDNLMIAFGSGDKRQTFFDISISTDGVTYEKIFEGLSFGGTLNHEKHSIGGKRAKYIKLGFDGNTETGKGGWTSVNEVVVTRNGQ